VFRHSGTRSHGPLIRSLRHQDPATAAATLLLALNNTATYGGLACSSLLGGVVLLFIDRHDLSLVGAAMIAVALVLAEVTYLCIVRVRPTTTSQAVAA
jgi:predicted MFS family arabinose efflux permease